MAGEEMVAVSRRLLSRLKDLAHHYHLVRCGYGDGRLPPRRWHAAAMVVFILASSISAGLGLNPLQNVLSSLVAKDERKRQARRSTKFPSPTTSIQSHCFISADKGLTEILEDL